MAMQNDDSPNANKAEYVHRRREPIKQVTREEAEAILQADIERIVRERPAVITLSVRVDQETQQRVMREIARRIIEAD